MRASLLVARIERSEIRGRRNLRRIPDFAALNPGYELALPHHARDEPGLAARRLDFLFQEAMRLAAGIAGAGKGPGAAFVVGGAGGLAGLVALAVLELKTVIVAAGPGDRVLDAGIARLDDAGAADAGDAAIVRHPRRHRALQPAHRARGDVGRIAEGPGAAMPVTFTGERAIGRIARGHR